MIPGIFYVSFDSGTSVVERYVVVVAEYCIYASASSPVSHVSIKCVAYVNSVRVGTMEYSAAYFGIGSAIGAGPSIDRSCAIVNHFYTTRTGGADYAPTGIIVKLYIVRIGSGSTITICTLIRFWL